MNNLDKQYTDLLQDILDNGVTKSDRTGTGTISVFGRQIRHKMSEGFPLLTTKKMYMKGIITELLWFLRGDTNIKFLVDNDCHIWDGDCYQAYLKNWKPTDTLEELDDPYALIRGTNLVDERPLPKDMFIHCIKTDDEFAEKWGELGKIYGYQWRGWTSTKAIEFDVENFAPTKYGDIRVNDQIANSINLLKTDPDSRRNRVSAWNVGELDQMVLPPCHTDFQFYTRELSLEERNYSLGPRNAYRGIFSGPLAVQKELDNYKKIFDEQNRPTRAISLMWNQRSVDSFLGLPFNIASYGLLLEIIAKEVNMVPDELIGNLGDTHLYLNHIEQAKEQIGREMTTAERNEWFQINLNGNNPLMKSDWKDYELDQQNIPTRTRVPYPLPTLVINDEFWNPDIDLLSNLPHIQVSDFYVDNYQSHPTIKAPLSN